MRTSSHEASDNYSSARSARFTASNTLDRLLLLGGALLFAHVSAALANTVVTGLRCESLDNPLGIDATNPRLSWLLQSTERGQHQTAYQVLVATNPSQLKADHGDLWDSGKVASDQSIEVPYAGAALGSFTQCFWKVRVWDAADKPSAWSPAALWTMGLLSPADWHAQWIGIKGENVTNYLSSTDWIWFPEGDPTKAVPIGSCCFRRVFALPEGREVRRARLLYTGDSDARAFVNGRDIGARDNYHVVRDSDLTYRLEPGTNIIAVLARNRGSEPKPAGFVALLEIQFDTGQPLIIPTDEQWKTATNETRGWTELGFDDSTWVAAKKAGPVGMAPWGKVRAPEDRRLPARWLRKQFAVEKKLHRATVYFSGLGDSELYLNGRKVGDAVLSPAVSEYTKRAYYVTYDVTAQLQRGPNALGVILGNGRFYAVRSSIYSGMPSYGFPSLLLQLRLEYNDGSVAEIVSDTTWKVTADGPILANNEYDGEEYDARKELGEWSKAGFDDSAWRPAQVMPTVPPLVVAQMIEPIRVTQTLKPIGLTQPKPGTFIYDFGQNMVGWCRLKVSGPAGTRISLRFAETLKPDGTLFLANLRGAQVTDIYTFKGHGTEIWEPRFTYHGFRYVELTSATGIPSLDWIEGRVVHDDLKTAGEFLCSNRLLNRIYTNVIWGVRGNYRSIPTDCPQRDERQGWMGDRSEESRGESYLFNNRALYAKWLQDMADSQKASGSVPDVCPAFWPIYSDNVTWPSSTVIIPSMVADQFGDTRVIARHYDSAKRWVDYMLGFVNDGLISKDSYGDWCMPPEDPKLIHSADPARQTDKRLLASSYFYHDLRLMEHYATILGKTSDAQYFRDLAEKFKSAFNDKFLNRELGQYDNGTQTSSVLPLAFGLVPDDERAAIFAHLVHKITEESKGHIGTGLIGGQYLNRVLTDFGRADLAYTIATQQDYPSWGYMLSKGATTIWELWNGDTADPAMNSGNHVMLIGDLVIWLYEDLAGIKPDPQQPGFKHLLMKPHAPGDLDFVKATHHSPYGLIVSEWHKHNGDFDWQVTIPANTTATIWVPAKSADRVTEGRTSASHSRGVEFLRMETSYAVYQIGSGAYHFVSE